jgi:hypothetical protein
MRTESLPFRVGVFADPARARRAIEEARNRGLTDIVVVTEDPAVQELFRKVCDDVRGCIEPVHRSPGELSPRAALLGAGIGLLAAFVGVWFFERAYGPPGAILNVAIPLAGVIWGAFIGAMISRGWQGEVENFYDQELGPGEILVAIEARDPERAAIAEKILHGEGVTPLPLERG